MKVKKESINLVNKKKNALSTTAQLLNLKKNKFKTPKNDFQNPKKAPFAKQHKLNLALSELNVGLEGKPRQKKKIIKGDTFNVGISHSNVKIKNFNKQQKTTSTNPKSVSKNSETIKTVQSLSESQAQLSEKPRSTPKRTLKYKSPISNGSQNKNKGNKLGSQQLDKTENTRKLSKRKGWGKSKKIKTPKPTSTRLNPVGEERLDLTKVTTAVSGLFKLISPKSQNAADLLGLEMPIFLEVECIKIPQCPIKQLRYKLPHPLMNELSDILLITTDLKGRKPDPEKAVDHYNELLKKHNVTFIQKVMPIRMLRQECTQYETKQKLVDQFDMILVDSAASKAIPKLLGKFAMFNRKMPIPVHLDRKDLKSHLEIARSKTQMTLKPNGHMCSVQVGHSKMSASEIAENIVEISKTMPLDYPGGWSNIRSLQIKTTDACPVLVYVSYMSPNMVKPQVVVPKNERAIEDELSTFPGKTVVVERDGNVYIKQAVNYEDPEDNSQDDEILKEAENYIQSSRTVRFDDDSDDDKDAEAITKALEKRLQDKYEKNAIKSAEQRGSEEEDEDEEKEEDSDEEEEPILPATGKKRKLESAKKGPKGKLGSPHGKKFKETKQQHNFKSKQNGETDQNKKRGSRGGKKQKMNKVQRKAQLKLNKAGKK